MASNSAAAAHETDLEAPSVEEDKELGATPHASTTLTSLQEDALLFSEKLAKRAGEGDVKATRRNTSMLDRLAVGGSAVSFAKLKRLIPVTLQWQDLSYTVTVGKRKKKRTKTVLEGVSGHCMPGQLLAVMGPTGSGKTSLVNAVAGRLPPGGSLAGSVLVNGSPPGRGYRGICAYVLQDDVLFANLTVRETLDFAANIRLPGAISRETRSKLVDDVIAELGLGKAAGTFIGGVFTRGISGGERKRVNIAVEMLSNPSLIFLDEPTSGLDAFQALNVMEALWTLAGAGRTVVCTIHQPRSSIFRMFDRLLLLSEGRTIYFGEAAASVAWFAEAGFQCPPHFNPADFFMDAISLDYRSPDSEATTRNRVALLGDLYQERQGAGTGEVRVDEATRRDMLEVDAEQQFANHVGREFGLLIGRAWRQASRNRPVQIATLAQTTFIGLLLAWLYSGMDKSYKGIQDETGLLFFVTIFTAFGSMISALTTFSMEIGIINSERASKSYRVLPYYVARFICDMPLRVGQGLLFGCLLYWIVGFNPSASAFFIFCCLVICEGLAGQGLGVAISAVASEKIALAIAPVITIFLMLFSGFYVNTDTIPPVLRWIRYISHLYWAFMGYTINDFSGRTGWGCPTDVAKAAAAVGAPCVISGDQILTQLNFADNHLWESFVGLLGLAFGYNALGYVLLRYLAKPRYLAMTSSAKKAA